MASTQRHYFKLKKATGGCWSEIGGQSAPQDGRNPSTHKCIRMRENLLHVRSGNNPCCGSPWVLCPRRRHTREWFAMEGIAFMRSAGDDLLWWRGTGRLKLRMRRRRRGRRGRGLAGLRELQSKDPPRKGRRGEVRRSDLRLRDWSRTNAGEWECTSAAMDIRICELLCALHVASGRPLGAGLPRRPWPARARETAF